MITVNDLKSILIKYNILKKYDLDKIGIFGSFARGEEFNDIDFFIDKDDINYQKVEELQAELESIINIKVDLMQRKYANPIVLYRAKKDMIYVTARIK